MAEHLTAASRERRTRLRNTALAITGCIALAGCSAAENAPASTNTDTSPTASQPPTYSMIKDTTDRAFALFQNPPKNTTLKKTIDVAPPTETLQGTFGTSGATWELTISPLGATRADQVASVSLHIKPQPNAPEEMIGISQGSNDQQPVGGPVEAAIGAGESGPLDPQKAQIPEATSANFEISATQAYDMGSNQLMPYDSKDPNHQATEHVMGEAVFAGTTVKQDLCFGVYVQNPFSYIHDALVHDLDALRGDQPPTITPPPRDATTFVGDPLKNQFCA